MDRLFAALRSRGWIVGRGEGGALLLPEAAARRYHDLPAELRSFLASIEVCRNPAGNVWFLSPEVFTRKEGEGFRWDEFERMGLECAEESDRDLITRFWDRHFPFLFAVHSDYDYLAARLTPAGFGSIVHGYAPDWEDPTPVAASFASFLEAFTAAAESRQPTYPFNLFLRE